MPRPESLPGTLVLACGALVRELRGVLDDLDSPNADVALKVEYLPAPLHNRPEKIVPAITERLDRLEPEFDRVLLGYGDCGTGGLLDVFINDWNASGKAEVSRLEGDHCYSFLTGVDTFAQVHGDELGTFFFTDFIVKNFDSLIWGGLGLDKHPQLRDAYFGNYTRAVWLAQTDNPELEAKARTAATCLGLRFERHDTGLTPFGSQVLALLGSR